VTKTALAFKSFAPFCVRDVCMFFLSGDRKHCWIDAQCRGSHQRVLPRATESLEC